MFITSFLTFMTIGGFPSFVEDMKVCFVCRLSIDLLFFEASINLFLCTLILLTSFNMHLD